MEKPSDDLHEVDQVEEEFEEEFDETDYVPAFIQKVLDDPELLPREIRERFRERV